MDLDGVEEVEEQESILAVPPNSREDGGSTWMDGNKDKRYLKKTNMGNPGRAISIHYINIIPNRRKPLTSNRD